MWQPLKPFVRTDSEAKPYWVWFRGRRTAILADGTSRESAIAAARLKKKRGGDAVETCRLAKSEEYKSGAWFRGGPNGEKPGESRLKGFGPELKSLA